jgi:hypothetical protein
MANPTSTGKFCESACWLFVCGSCCDISYLIDEIFNFELLRNINKMTSVGHNEVQGADSNVITITTQPIKIDVTNVWEPARNVLLDFANRIVIGFGLVAAAIFFKRF